MKGKSGALNIAQKGVKGVRGVGNKLERGFKELLDINEPEPPPPPSNSFMPNLGDVFGGNKDNNASKGIMPKFSPLDMF